MKTTDLLPATSTPVEIGSDMPGMATSRIRLGWADAAGRQRVFRRLNAAPQNRSPVSRGAIRARTRHHRRPKRVKVGPQGCLGLLRDRGASESHGTAGPPDWSQEWKMKCRSGTAVGGGP